MARKRLHGTRHRDATAGTWMMVALMAGWFVAPASAQLYAPGGVVPNPHARPGQIHRNPIVSPYSINATNPYVTGNARYGRSFQGFSPLRDSGSLFISRPSNFGSSTLGSSTALPSDSLSNFTRDSFSLSDMERSRRVSTTNRNLYYYSPQSTVANTGAITRGLNVPGTSQFRSSDIVPGALPRQRFRTSSLGLGSRYEASTWGVPTQLVRVSTGRTLTGQVNERLLNSALFGSAVRAVPMDALAAQAAHDQSFGKPAIGPLDLRASRGPVEPAGSREGTIGQTGVGNAGISYGANSPLERLLGRRPAGAGVQELPQASGVTAGLNVRSTGMSRGDLFRQLQAAAGVQGPSQTRMGSLGLSGGVRGITTEEPAGGIGPAENQQGALIVRRRTARAQEREGERAEVTPSAGRFDAGVAGLLDHPLKTFVGTEESVINAYLAQAETHLKNGQYYRAVTAYDLARVVDVRNPLPLMGRSMALLVAGDYLTSANDLFHAIRLFESLARFQIDLRAFVPDLDALDRRRADLEQRLESYDDFRLRFLLGYAEYCSGLETIGLVNLRKAAQSAPEEMEAVRRFVDILDQRVGGKPSSEDSTIRSGKIPAPPLKVPHETP